MRKTVENTDSYVEAILADYPYFPEHAKSFLAEELTALQRGYFTLFKELRTVDCPLSSDQTLTFETLGARLGALPEKEDVIALFLAGKELPKRTLLHFLRSELPGFTIENETILCRSDETNATVTVVVACLPEDISYTPDAGFEGEIRISKAHLPMVSARLRELAARLCGEEEEADHFADCYNAWLARLKEEEKDDRD